MANNKGREPMKQMDSRIIYVTAPVPLIEICVRMCSCNDLATTAASGHRARVSEGIHVDKYVICLAREEKWNSRGDSGGHQFVFRHIRFSFFEIFSKLLSVVALENAHNVKNAFLYDRTLLSPPPLFFEVTVISTRIFSRMFSFFSQP